MDIGNDLNQAYLDGANESIEVFREWILTHYEPAITDLIEKTVSAHGNVNGWDEVSVDEMLEELHFELKEGLLNVVDSYLKEGNYIDK